MITEIATCPWNHDHRLLHIGLRGRQIPKGALPPANFVFFIDVSGSMARVDKLPLLKVGLRLLVDNLRPNDHLTLITYAGKAELVLNQD